MNYRKIDQEKWTRIQEYKEELELPFFYLGKYLYVSIIYPEPIQILKPLWVGIENKNKN